MYQVKSYDIEIFPNYALFVFVDVEPYMEMYRRIHDPKTKKLLVSESEKIRLIKEIPRVHFEISSVEGYEKNDLLALLDYCNQWDYLVGSYLPQVWDALIKYLQSVWEWLVKSVWAKFNDFFC